MTHAQLMQKPDAVDRTNAQARGEFQLNVDKLDAEECVTS